MSNSYKCSLDASRLKKAKDEICEDPNQTMGAVKTFKEWIQTQKHIKCPTDTIFLLKFLRAAKFSQLGAREWLTNYVTVTTKRPELFSNIDMADKKIQAFLRSGYVIFPETRDPEGRQIMIIRPGLLDTSFRKYDKESIYKAIMGAHLYFLTQEEVQVCGFTYVMDATGFSVAVSKVWNFDDMKLNGVLTNKCFPARINTFNYYNVHPVVETIFEVFLSFIAKKMRDRIKGHGNNLESLYEVVPLECLPEEYLPDDYTGPQCGPIQAIVDTFADKVFAPDVRESIFQETNRKNLHIDLKNTPNTNIQESFRKLCVD